MAYSNLNNKPRLLPKEVLHMDEATIKSIAVELAKGLKTPEDSNQMTAVFKKFMIETALNTELSDHLGYEASV